MEQVLEKMRDIIREGGNIVVLAGMNITYDMGLNGVNAEHLAYDVEQKYGYPKWQAALLAAVLIALLGVLLILNPFGALVITVRVLGGVILVDGIMGIWVGLTMKKFS